MLPPYELEGKTFKRVMKGYNPVEVDEYVDFLIEKYKELYRAYSDLEKSHTAAKAELLTYKENESAIRKTLESAKSEGDQLLDRAKERSASIMKTARDEFDATLDKYKKRIAEQAERLRQLTEQVANFKTSIFLQYQQHIEYLEQIAPDGGYPVPPSSDDVVERTMKTVSQRVLSAAAVNESDVINRAQEHPGEAPAEDVDSVFRPMDPDDPGDSDNPDEFSPIGAKEPQNPNSTGDTLKFHILTDLPPEMSKAEDVIFGEQSSEKERKYNG